ncbi:selenocysteine-specific translation elongation factor [Aquibacillus halophilus]|uniref:Selenocysteine-specific elongation factor n=1 Tax=Aquibacillus halophilus TaxID=930132 RepID=A0A6A8D866_9BACI|nr:selenocysteine-specific translation elongation factor [Aquibacillus halophilus]MRH41778.1 selenocysteine-specific translation elongation factor [Aquibacillus halophilus]
MEATYYTIGMAGHIDHGKTTLTKALTNVDTDRLKEEKQRNISIEAGYAPLHTKDGTHVSIVDVPGHERFIRQMIAGVAGIDLVVLVVAADEGVMPQTKEHLEILEFLGIKRCIVTITKIDRVDEELLELIALDIDETLSGTSFENSPMVNVDSVSGKGIDTLKESIFHELQSVEHRDRYGSFRLPIDQVFTVQGQGTIVRGTVYEGIVKNGSLLRILPGDEKVKARNIQVHHQDVEEARAGQRTAINLTGVEKDGIKRGDVLVASDHFLVTDTIDVAIRFVTDLRSVLKQRSPVKLHVGTSEVMGKIVFFDRNSVEEINKEVLCQIRLDNEIVVRRGDRFILRRPTPVETIGGGWVIEPKGEKYRFGDETIKMLQKKKEGTPEDLIKDVLKVSSPLTINQIIQATSLDQKEVQTILNKTIEKGVLVEIPGNKYVLSSQIHKIKDDITDQLTDFHDRFPMRLGMNKAELVQLLRADFSKEMVEYTLEQMVNHGTIKKIERFIANENFEPHLPTKWKTRMEEIISNLKADELEVKKWEDYISSTPISKDESAELRGFLLLTNRAYQLTDDMIVHKLAINQAVDSLQQQTGTVFDLKDAKDILNVSRKYLIPLLELLDSLHHTEREEGKRRWL